MKRCFLLLAASALFLSCDPEGPTDGPKLPTIYEPIISTDVVMGMLRVKLQAEASPTEALEAFASQYEVSSIARTFPPCGAFEARTRAHGLHLWYDVSFNPQVPLTKAAGDLRQKDGIAYVEFVEKLRPQTDGTFPFNDPGLADQWHFYNPGTKYQYEAGCDINLFPAWEITTGKPEVIVAVADEGIDVRHEDLRNMLWVNEAEKNGTPGVDDDGNGYVDDIHGFNFNKNSQGNYVGTVTPAAHGCNVAGIIAAQNNNGLGYCGIAGGDGSGNGVRLMSCQMLSESQPSDPAPAIKYAADNGAVIINNSWGYKDGSASVSRALVDAVNYFIQYAGMDASGKQVGPMAGGLVVFAAGNDNATEGSPASKLDQVVPVSAIGAAFKKSSFSNYGSWVKIAAPGGDFSNPKAPIFSTGVSTDGNGYSQMQGTSQAAPHVSGVAALVVSQYGGPGFSVEMLKEILFKSARPIDMYNTAHAGKLGAGLLDAGAALTLTQEAPPQLRAEDVELSAVSNSIAISFAAVEAAVPSLFAYDIYYSTRSLAGLSLSEELPAEVSRVRLYRDGSRPTQYSLHGLAFGQNYCFRINAFDRYNRSTGLSAELWQRTDEANRVPTLTALDGTQVAVKAHETQELRFEMDDADGHALKVGFTAGSPAATYRVEGKTITLTFTGKDAPAGTYTALLSVSDPFSTSEPMEVKYTLLENHAPEVIKSLPNTVLSAKNEKVAFDLSEYFRDVDGEALTYTVVSSAALRVADAVINGNELSLTAQAFGTSFISVTAKDFLGEQVTATFELLVRDGAQEVDVYPNPVRDALYLRTSQEKNAQVRITSVSGHEVYSGSLKPAPFAPAKVDVSGFAAGTYTVVLDLEGKRVTRRIVKL